MAPEKVEFESNGSTVVLIVMLPPDVAAPVNSPFNSNLTRESADMASDSCMRMAEFNKPKGFKETLFEGEGALGSTVMLYEPEFSETKNDCGKDMIISSPDSNSPPTDVRNSTLA